MDMIDNMRMFVRVVEAGSFTAAAKQADTSTGMMSRAISSLEGHLETRLLHRSTRRLALTDSGRRYFERLKSILNEVDEAAAEARNALVRPYGRLHIHSMPGLGQRHVTAAIVAYQADYPDVTVELTLSQRVPNLIEDGYDLSIVTAPSLPDSAYVTQTFGISYSILVASPEYLEKMGTPKSPTELGDHVCLGLDTPAAPANEWRLQGPEGEVSHILLSAPFQVNIPEAMGVALRAGRGIGSLAIYSAIDDIRSGKLVRVLPEYRLQTLNVYAVYVSRFYLDAKVRTFLDHLRTTLSPALAAEERELMRIAVND